MASVMLSLHGECPKRVDCNPRARSQVRISSSLNSLKAEIRQWSQPISEMHTTGLEHDVNQSIKRSDKSTLSLTHSNKATLSTPLRNYMALVQRKKLREKFREHSSRI
ncbi:hypothetical protein CDAR_56111 [Caerostris darwini]|uniref:Uncharacterized protein n=1 Tax=Caerostris darwini TaxID=1538125 RepID=A0AAV4RPY5_9ARAC|nr:hypothetical protein CDAR_56111 [Caerostris darwini]